MAILSFWPRRERPLLAENITAQRKKKTSSIKQTMQFQIKTYRGKQNEQTALPQSRSAPSSTKHAAVFVVNNDGDFNEIH